MKCSVVVILAAITMLQGCAAVVVGAGVGAASAAHDRRTLGTQVDDQTAQARLSSALSKDEALDKKANINVHVFNGVALLVGQAQDESVRQQAYRTASSVKNIRKLHNQIRIGAPISAASAANDAWLATKIKTALVTDKRIDGLHIDVAVENAEVFLMGLVKPTEADIAVDIARNISGVEKVIKAFEDW